MNIESAKEFAERNGGNALFYEGWLRFENGALAEAEPHGVLRNPPTDEYELCTNIVLYREAQLERAVRAFDEFKTSLMNAYCAKPEGLEHLAELKNIVEQCNAAVLVAKEKLANTETAKQQERNRKQEAENRQKMDAFFSQVKAVSI